MLMTPCPPPGIEWQLSVDRSEAAKYGVDITLVGESIRLITNGLRLGNYRPDDSEDEIDIVVRYPAEYRTVRQLGTIFVLKRSKALSLSAILYAATRFRRLPKSNVRIPAVQSLSQRVLCPAS